MSELVERLKTGGAVRREKLIVDFKSRDVRYPKFLTEVPLFSPVKMRKTASANDEEGYKFYTLNGYVERHGPGLNMFDQDTLIALLQLVPSFRLEGPASNLPIPLSMETGKDAQGNDTVVVLSGRTTARQVNKYLGRSFSDEDLQFTRDSIKRLSLTVMFICTDCFSDTENFEGNEYFFKYRGSSDFKGSLQFQFSPGMVTLLQNYATINLDVRKKLSPTGKAVHIYMSGHQSDQIHLTDLKSMVAPAQALPEFRRALLGKKGRKGQLEVMKACGFLAEATIDGNGKSAPYILTWERVTV